MAISTPNTQIPSREEVIDQARALAPGFRERATAAEEARQLPQESIDEMLEAGLARILTPRRFGGYELGLETWFDVVREIAKADASHGWCASLIVHHPHYISLFPEAAQQAVWKHGPDVAIAASVMPLCRVEAEEGGYRLTGRSPFTSGIMGSSWAIVGGFLPEPGPPKWALFLVDSDQYTVEDTWFTTGMRGTGSNTVVTENAFVSADRVILQSEMRDGTAPGGALNDGAIYRAPWYTYAPMTFVTPMLGAAIGAYETLRDWTRSRTAAGGAAVADFASVQTRLGWTAATLDAAELLLRRAAQVPHEEPVTQAAKARSIRDYARASELIVDASDALMKMSGMPGFGATNPIHRAWHDVHFAASHVSLNPDVNLAYFGRDELGREQPETVAF